jgi:type I restriction enzyme S subunit
VTKFTEHRLGDVARVTWGDTNTTKASYKERGFTAYSAAGPDGFLDHYDYDCDGIVLSAIGANCGGTWFASGRWSCIKNTIVITKAAEGVEMRYLFYVTNDPAIWPKRGAAQPFISQTDARAVPVRLPPLPTQQRIAAILSAHDDLIENNTRRIAILEEMARRLYEEWFVHFRFPGHEDAEFITSDAGDTPAGWPIRRLEELVQINPRTSVPSDGFKPFVPMGSLSETNMVIGPVEKREGNSGTKFQNNDTLVARITPCLENGKTGFVDFLTDEQPVGFGSTEFIVLRPAVLGRCAIYCLARSHAFRDVAIKSMSGSEGRQRVQPDSVKSFLVARPPTDLLDRFEDFARPCFRQVSALAKKNANLRAQRDMLLPKLISGEIDVSGAAELLEAAE